jgi:hypothetical protein
LPRSPGEGTLDAMSRTVIVGDVHGCRSELDALLDKVAFAGGDRLVLVGDVVARGPDSLGVLDIARRTGAVLVRGNHEEKLLAWYAYKQGKSRPGRRAKRDESLGRMHSEVAEALRPVDWTLLDTSPLWIELPEHGCAVVHAGVLPGIPLAEQEWDTLLQIRGVTARHEPSDAKTERLWGELYEGPPHIVFGHNARSEPQLHAWATGLDTACVYGGRLTAMVLPAGLQVPRGRDVEALLVSVPAERTYYDWQKKKRVE